MIKKIRAHVAYVVIMVLLAMIVCPANIWAQRSNGTTRQRYEDPRGLNRYTLTGETAPLTIFSLPAYNPRDPEFFDGYGRMTAKELGLDGAEFWNEFGKRARKGYLDGKAVLLFPNGFQWNEAYLEGCLKNGKVYYNRIKLDRKPTIERPRVVRELCVNIPLAVGDVPPDWTVTTRSDGRKECHYPVPEPDPVECPPGTEPGEQPGVCIKPGERIDNTCRPGAPTRIFEHHDKKGFNPAEVIRQKLDATTADRILALMAIPDTTAKVTSVVIYSNGCDYAVWANSVIKKGLGWWKWVIPIAIAAAFLAGYYLRGGRSCKSCGSKVEPIKATPTTGSPTPGRPRRY